MNKEQKLFIMLVGLPMSGKSSASFHINKTFGTGLSYDLDKLSSDDIIDNVASMLYTTYNNLWDKLKDDVQKAFDKKVKIQFNLEKNMQPKIVLWDQTNLSKKSRAGKLAKVPSYFRKIAIYFPLPNEEELNNRKQKRIEEGKIIPDAVFENMKSQLEIPSINEGFDEIYEYKDNNFYVISAVYSR